MNRYLTGAGVLVALATSATSAVAAPFRIVVNGSEISTGVAPAVINNSLLVPLAAIGTSLGAYMEWRPGTRTVYGRLNMNEFSLPINSRTALVNGASAPVDPPAQIVSGRTMVPLRFVATALGADVRFEGSTKTVLISTAGGTAPTPGTTPPPANVTLDIDRFYVSPETPLNAGDSFTVTLEGTPGLKAEFDYGSQRNIQLPEVSPGRYVRSMQVPEKAPFARTVITGRLAAGNRSREVQAGSRVVVDTTAPNIDDMRPTNTAIVKTADPWISAEFDDQGQTGVDESSVKILLNGEDVTGRANVTAERVIIRETLPTGENRARVEVADLAGNRNAVEWRFTVSGQQAATGTLAAPTITEPDPDEALSGPIRVEGTAPPGATVRVRTTYRGTVLLVFSQQGEVNTQEVKAGADGKWRTEPITLKAPSGVSGVRYTITATTINAEGLTSEPAQVTVPKS